MAPRARIWVAFVATLLASFAWSHPASIASARAKVQLDGSFELKIRFDILAYCLDIPPSEIGDAPMNALIDGPAAELEASLRDAANRFQSELRGFGDGKAAKLDGVEFPSAAEVEALARDSKPRLPVIVTLTLGGHLPSGTSASSFAFPQGLGTVVLTTEFPYQEPVSEPVEPGQVSASLSMPSLSSVAATKERVQAHLSAASVPFAGAVARASSRGQENVGTTLAKREPLPSPVPIAAVASSAASKFVEAARVAPSTVPPLQSGVAWYESFPRYVRMGFVHIVPQGLDHILFVLGLFLLSTRTKDLLKQITAFTLAHSLTLALSLYGVVQLPRAIVEPVIALSIVFVAVENLWSTSMHRWRVGVVFLFGLVHGLGFASALRDAGLAHGDFLTALVGFNGGVELGQLSVIAAALLAVGWFRSHARYRSLVAVPASAVIALTAVVWTVERLL